MGKSGKRILIIIIILGALVSVGILSTMITPDTEIEYGDQVGRLYLRGPIQDSFPGFGTEVITPSFVESRLEEARDQGLEALVIRIDTSGGSVAASQEIYSMLQNYEKPVVFSIGDMAASGGYYIASAGDSIVAQPGSMTGSIGVISTFVDPEGLLEKIGVELEIITTGKHKDMFMRGLTDEEKEKMQELSDNAYQQFVEDVSVGRNMGLEEVTELATGELFTGEQAFERDLVDELGGIDKALEVAAVQGDLESPHFYDFPEPGLIEQLWGFSYRVPEILFRAVVSPEIFVLENLNDGLSPVIKYQVPGY